MYYLCFFKTYDWKIDSKNKLNRTWFRHGQLTKLKFNYNIIIIKYCELDILIKVQPSHRCYVSLNQMAQYSACLHNSRNYISNG